MNLSKVLRKIGVSLLLLGLVNCSSAVPQELRVKNADFENWSNAGPNEWFISDQSRKRGMIESVTAPVASGSFALRLAPGKKNADEGDPISIGQLLPLTGMDGKTLIVNVSLASTGDTTAILGLSVLNAKGQAAVFKQIRQEADDKNILHEHSATLKVPEKAKDMQLILFCAADGINGTALFDNLTVQVKDTAENGDDDSNQGPLSATLRVDITKEIRQVPTSLFGTNVEWINNGNDMWDITKNRVRPDVIRESKDLGITLIRFPGGVFSDYYNWRDGVGSGKRKTAIHYPDGPESTHNFGTDEALDFAHNIGARLLITVNAGSGTANDAASWVEYVNGKNGASPKVDRVEYWEIGNELYTKNDLSGGSLPPKEYSKNVKDFARAMRAVDPNIKIGAIGGINQGTYNIVEFSNWTKTVLSEVGSEIDFLAVHNSYGPIVISAGNPKPNEVYKAMLAAPVRIQRNMDDLNEAIKKYVPGDKRPVLAITEWGPLFHILPSSEWVDHVKTIGSAVFVADVMRVFLETPGVDIANFFKLSEPTFIGWLGPDKSGTYITKPVAEVFKMYSQDFGSTIVSTQISSPTYSTEGIGMVASVNDVPYVSAISSISQDRNRLYIVATNKHLKKPIDLTIAIPTNSTSDAALVHLLSGNSPDAHTGTKLLKIPGFTWAEQKTFGKNTSFNESSMANVHLKSSEAAIENSSITYALPPHSIVKFEVDLK